jgi:hypothetical protein
MDLSGMIIELSAARMSGAVGGTVHLSRRCFVMMGRLFLAVVVFAYFMLVAALGAVTKARSLGHAMEPVTNKIEAYKSNR